MFFRIRGENSGINQSFPRNSEFRIPNSELEKINGAGCTRMGNLLAPLYRVAMYNVVNNEPSSLGEAGVDESGEAV